MPIGGELGIRAGEYWAFRRTKHLPLVRAQVLHPGRNYYDQIRIRLVDEPAQHELTVFRNKLPCKWEDLDQYLEAHPDVPRGAEVVAAAPVHIVHTTNELREIIHDEIRNALGVHKIAYTWREAAAAVGVSVSTLRAAVHLGELQPGYSGNKPLFAESELRRWVEELPRDPGWRA